MTPPLKGGEFRVEAEDFDGSVSYQSSVSIMHAALVLAGPADALTDAEQAAELEPRASPYRPAIAAMIGTYRFMTGADGGYYALLIEGAQAATGPPEIAVYALSNLALNCAWWRDRETAGRYANEAVGLLGDDDERNLVMYGLAYAVSAHVAIANSQVANAERMLTVGSRIEQQAPDSAPFDSFMIRPARREPLRRRGPSRSWGGRSRSNRCRRSRVA